MSVDQLPPGKVRAAARDAKLVGYDEYIDTQIQSTRRMVKAVDATTALLTMAAGTLAFLLVVAVVEHWFVPGGFSTIARGLLFAALIGGVGYFAVRRLWPLCVRPINPVYAAHTIEQGSPSLKNSLLNLILFRQQRDEITDAVYETLEEQAARRLVHVPVDAAVDRTYLLRLGYVMVAVVLLCALYKVLSPKDPLVTAARVLMPWSDIVPASRVAISNIEPGDATLARGELLHVSADVRGTGDDDPVVVRYSTADGQAVDKSVVLAPTAAGLRFTGQIPAASPGAPVGVAQNLRYRVEAGDARSREYAVVVVAAPTITVERIDYDYPDYTGFADRSVSGLGDIRAIEGTSVTIHARANEPIEEAAVDFEADGRRDIVMAVADTQARTPLVLALRDDRQTPKFTSYVLRFTTVDGRKNSDPVKFAIDVLPDYEPEVAIVAPQERFRDVRLDETIAIEVEARDPDFALADVRLQGDVAGRTVLDEPLLVDAHTGRFAGRLLFTPRDHKLQVGDTMRYWAAARDNRQPEIGPTTSEPQTLRVVSPDRVAQRDQRQPQQGDPSQNGEQQQGESGESGGEAGGQSAADGQQQQSGESGSADGNQQQSGESGTADGNSGAQGEQDAADNSGEQSGNPSADGENGDGQPSGNQSTDGQQGEQAGDSQLQPGGTAGSESGKPSGDQSRQPSTGRQSGGQQGESQPSDGKSGANSTGDGQRDGEVKRDAGQNGEQRTSDSRRDPGAGGEPEPGQESRVSPDGDNDGEAFERIQKFLQNQGKSQPPNGSQDASRDAQQSDAGERSEDGKREDSSSDAAKDAGSNQGEGAETRPGDPPRKADRPADQTDQSKSPGGQQTGSKGESGAGDSPQNQQGSPDSQPNMKPGDKWQQRPSGENPSNDQEPPSGGRGKRESDSQGGQGGDRAGGGEEGGGQKANREGTGSAGQNQSADEGAGESSEQGAGDDSANAGHDAKASDRTGQSGSDELGKGSSQRDGQGEQQGGETAGAQPGRDDAPARSGDPNDRQPANGDVEQQLGNAAGSSPSGDGTGVPEGAGQPTKTDGTAPPADAANLEYAQKQTDLVLESLADQLKRKQVDKRLLDELGWTPEDLERFLERWQQLKTAAGGEGPSADAARRQLDDSLRSLGLRRGPLRQSAGPDDDVRDLRQGYRGAVPLEYQERLRAYNQGVSRARPDEQ